LKDVWQIKWDINLKGRHLYDINKTVSFAITAPKLYRYNEILFFRLRTGYIKLNSYLNNVLMSSLYRGLNTYIFFKLKECLASLSANSFPSIPTWLGIHSKITFMPILLSDENILYIS
jgi:hypothetical protein